MRNDAPTGVRMMLKKAPLYSRSRPPLRPDSGGSGAAGAPGGSPAAVAAAAAATPATAPIASTSSTATPPGLQPGARLRRHERLAWAGALLLVLGALVWNTTNSQRSAPFTMAQIDAALRQSIRDKPLASPAARAYEKVLPSVVGVVGLMTDGDDGSEPKRVGAQGGHALERGVGSGVVIVDNGTILTNLHVVQGARRIRVTFMDGSVSDAVVMNTQPENDLAVLRAKTIPDDLFAATLRSTTDLAPGDQLLAVGFPFGIGPSASAGIVSGLKREFHSPEGATLTNLIQFDAAANPGSSGGPLVTMDGEVVGIVTAILNPSQQRVFIGIGFAVPIENAAGAVGMAPF